VRGPHGVPSSYDRISWSTYTHQWIPNTRPN
jgi:hypothetical protein